LGGRHHKIDEFIKKELLNEDKLGWELEKSVIKEKSPENPEETREIRKSFYYALNKLLENDKIEIIGYEKRGKVKQSFSAHSFLFSLSERLSYPQAKNFLKNFDSDDDKTRSQLTNVFKRKYIQFEKQEMELYQEIREKVTSLPLDDWINEDKKLLKKLISEYPRDPGYSPEISALKANLAFQNKQLTKYPNARMWKLEGLSLEEYNKILKSNERTKSLRETDEKIFSNMFLLDKDGNITIEQFLEQKGIFKLEEKTLKEIRSTFNEVLFFINSCDNYNFMQQSFAWALSDEEDSMEWFKLFINNDIFPKEELKDAIGIKKTS
jgi:hypothetical protein